METTEDFPCMTPAFLKNNWHAGLHTPVWEPVKAVLSFWYRFSSRNYHVTG